MNQIMTDKLIKVKQAEINQETRNDRIFNEGIQASDHTESLRKLMYGLASTGAIIIFVMRVIGVVK